MNLGRTTERCLVGALLTEPEQLDAVSAWLELDDLEGTAERQAYAAMLEIKRAGRDVTPQGVDAVSRDRASQGTHMADAVYLVSVMHETPDTRHAPAYGRMVLELSIRRRVSEGAAMLRQQAEAASSTDQLNRVFASVDAIRRAVEGLHLRESRAENSHSVAPATDHDMPRLMRFPHSEELAAEQAVVLALVEQPRRITDVTRWLKPNDFGDDEAGSLFKELVEMRQDEAPIDRLTVAWQATKVGIEGPLVEALSEGSYPTAEVSDPRLAARTVLEQSVKAALIATSEELQSSATDSSVRSTTAAYTRLNALWPQQRRLVKAQVEVVPRAGLPAP